MIKDIRANGLMIMLMAYSLTYTLALPVYFRYRTPIEPLVFVLTGLLLGTILRVVQRVAVEYSRM
jgi:hypothetical protein